MQAVCVYLGASLGNSPKFSESVVLLGQAIAQKGLRLVYGGSSLGTMGLLADTVKHNGGMVEGVITHHLIKKEKPPTFLDHLHVVESMQERKEMMRNMADMFLVMPGGIGTLEEVFDTWNAIKLGLLDKPIGFLNQDHFFDLLLNFVGSCEQHGFLSEADAGLPLVYTDVSLLLTALIGKGCVK